MVVFINMNINDKTLNLILRRVSPEYLEMEFTECLDTISNKCSINLKESGSIVPLATFRNTILSMTIDGIHNILVYTLPNELQWYDDVFYVLRKFYDERIEKRYDLIKRKYGINESVIKILREETIQDNLSRMIRTIGIKKTAKAVGSVERLIKILNFDGEDLNEFIYQYLKEEYHPDYNWGPELHDFYRNDVNEHGSYDFEVNDLFAYAYLGEWDGYDYLYALVITKWVNNGLTLLFGDKWIPVFKRWFEDNSGLEVRDIDLEGRYFDPLTEQTLRSQSLIGLNETNPDKNALKNICDSEKFCSSQGKITFGQLKAIVDSATSRRLFQHVGEGGVKATIRLLPWFIPQLAIAGFTGSIVRAVNKVLRPTLEETTSYKTWWGKVVMKMFDLTEGELNLSDPLSRIFFISDGLMTLMDNKYKVKFARYIAELASTMPEDNEVPEFFVENELRNWINNKFLLDPPLKQKKIEEEI